MFRKGPTPKASPVTPHNDDIDSELRPGGMWMCVQRRDDDVASADARGPSITIHVTHGPVHHVIHLPAHSTFGELKGLVSQKTGLEPEEQKLLFRGKEKEDEEHLDAAGVKDNSRVMLLQEPKRKVRSVGELNEGNEMSSDAAGEVGVESNEMQVDAGDIGAMSPEMAKAFEAIAGVRAEVDSLSDRVSALDVAVSGGTKVSDKEFAVSTELLMRQLLKLDGVRAEGEARMQRKAEVRRVQNLVDTLDTLKAKNSNPVNNTSVGVTSQNSNDVTSQNSNSVASQNGNAVSVTTKWETFDSGMGSLTAPTPMPSSAEVKEDWEKFE